MYRVLIVEDIEATRQNLSSLLSEMYDQWAVDGVESVAEADTKVEDALSKGEPYDLLIVDYHLPASRGSNPEPALDFTMRVFERLPNALVIQITAYMGEGDLQAKLIHPMLANPDPRLAFVPKNDGWSKEVCKIALQRVLGDPIEDQLDNLFGAELSVHSGYRSRRGRSPETISLTHSLASLRGLITASWDHLSPDLQNRIRSKFRVDDKIRPVKITVF
jgi:CheY-like chemotaxis protein